MKSIETIRANEKEYSWQLFERLKGDERLSLSCPDFKYPEPVYFYIKSVKTEKTIAVQIDGGDGTLRFWDYVDDSYENEDGVWANVEGDGFEKFINKLYNVMDNAVDIEFYGAKGITDDYFAGVLDGKFNETAAKALLKKHSAGVRYQFAKVSNFYGNKVFVFDRQLNPIRR